MKSKKNIKKIQKKHLENSKGGEGDFGMFKPLGPGKDPYCEVEKGTVGGIPVTSAGSDPFCSNEAYSEKLPKK